MHNGRGLGELAWPSHSLPLATLSAVWAPTALGASPTRVVPRISGALYCDSIPTNQPAGGFTCIADETIEIVGPSIHPPKGWGPYPAGRCAG
jgi:hypothetical protein